MQQNFLSSKQNKVLKLQQQKNSILMEQINFVKNLNKEKRINDEDSKYIIKYIEENPSLSSIIQDVLQNGFSSDIEFFQLIDIQREYKRKNDIKELEYLKTNTNQNSIDLIKKTFENLSLDEQLNEAYNFSSSPSIELNDTILLYKLVTKQFQYQLRPSQLLVVLELYQHEQKGRIAEISPGEGKTLITALLAILLVKKKLMNVQIITSSNSLAIRKSKELTQFYQLCNVSVSHNYNGQIDHFEGMSYQNQVIYGDVLSHLESIFQYGNSNQALIGNGVQGYIILNDEIDSLFLVGNSMDSDIQIKTKFQQHILLYQERLLGLTGCLGSEAHQDFLAKKYNLEFVLIPVHSSNQIVEGLAMIFEHKWLKSITNAVQEQKSNNKAVLIVAQSEGELNKIDREISRSKKIIKYTENDEISEIEIGPNTTIIATYQMILQITTKINKQLERNGGIHVIMSFLPQSSRLEELVFARILRKGLKGSRQLIVQTKESQLQELERRQENNTCQNLETLKQLRIQNEMKKLEDCQKDSVQQDEKQNKLLQQKIFNKEKNMWAQELKQFYQSEQSYSQQINTQESIQIQESINNIPIETNKMRLVESTILSSVKNIVSNKREVQMKEKEAQIVCLKHSEQATYVFCDEQLKGQDKLGCEKCLNEMNKINCERLESVKEQIYKRKIKRSYQLESLFSEYINHIHLFIENFKKKSSDFSSVLDHYLRVFQKFVEEIKDLQDKENQFSLLQEVDFMNADENFLIEKEVKEMQEKMNKVIQLQQINVKQGKQQIQNQIQNLNASLDIPPIYQDINYKLLEKFQQQEVCQVLSFNFDNSKIIAGQGQNLKVWDFQQDKLVDNKIVLKGHEQDIRSIVVSNKRNYLVSESNDSFLICWNLRENNQDWEQCLTKKLNSSRITCLIMNEAEDQLIYCGPNEQIWICKIDQQTNKVYEIQKLQQHKKQVNCVSLSKSNDTMVSCSEDDQIIIWTKMQRELWNFKQIIDAQGKRIQSVFFQSDDKIITFTSKGKIEGYIKNNNEYFQSENLRLDINSHQNICNSDYELIYNEMRQLLIIKNPQKIFFITKLSLLLQQNISKNSINCNKNTKVFNISKNGNYLVTWIGQPKLEFMVYEIQYHQ